MHVVIALTCSSSENHFSWHDDYLLECNFAMATCYCSYTVMLVNCRRFNLIVFINCTCVCM